MHGATSIQKFRSQWQYWLTDTERKISANILAIEPNLEELIQVCKINKYANQKLNIFFTVSNR